MTKPYGRIYKNKTNISIDARDLYNVWPVGSIYISVVNINPSEYFGGTWQVFGTGRCLVGIDTSQTEFNTIEKTGGEATHKLTVEEMPSHNHAIEMTSGGVAYQVERVPFGNQSVWGNSNLPIKPTGGSQPHNNMPPYLAVYVWKRVA